MPTPERGLPGWVKPAAIAGVGTVGIIAGTVASGALRGEPTPSVPPPPDHTAAASSPTPPEKTVIATPTGKVEVTFPPTTPTAEVKKEVPCGVIEQKYCDQAVVIHWKSPQGKDYTFIAFDLPPGTPIFTPVDGQLAKAPINQPSPFQGFVALTNDAKDPTVAYALRGDLEFPNMTTTNSKAGDKVGVIGNKGIKIFGKYNLIYDIQKAIQGGFVQVIESFQRDFPEAFKKPVQEVSYDGSTTQTLLKVFETPNPQSRP